MSEQAMFRERADLYDRIYSFKDYAAETARVRALLAAAGVPDGARVVEGACGTGSYLVPLAKHYAVEGFDLNAGILDVARTKVPGVKLTRQDLRDFALDAPADAVVCLFSSIGYVHGDADLRRAADCFFRAVRPGGVVLVEAWFAPGQFEPLHRSVQTAKSPDMDVVRAAVHLTAGRKSVFDFHWLVVTPQGTEHFVDRHELWQFTEEEMTGAFRAAGFDVRWVLGGLQPGRGLVVAKRP